MNIDDLTMGQVKAIQNMGICKNGVVDDKGEIKIVILQRGWVMVGKYYQNGTQCKLLSGSVIRSWGTTKGLGEIAKNGPTDNTKLDPIPETKFHELTIVATVSCNKEKWEEACS